MALRSRRIAREWAIKCLYAIDVGHQEPIEAIQNIFEEEELDNEADCFLKQLVLGVAENKDFLDKQIAKLSHEWALDRQPAVDRNILRMSSYELIYCKDIPFAATINEAVELTKKYSTAESGRFVNGVLGAILESLDNIKEESKIIIEPESTEEPSVEPDEELANIIYIEEEAVE